MKSIIESIIGRKGITKVLRSLDDLRYGDVIEIIDELEGITGAYVYMPMKLINQINHHTNCDGFITYRENISFWRCFRKSAEFRRVFPKHEDYGSLIEITRYITHINEWQSISSEDDIKKLFSKYNIPINETH